jgi:cytidine deaminase
MVSEELAALSPEERELVEAALAAQQQAYAPYSGYRVGAAVRTSTGRIFGGCNVEISSFSHTCCAERVAVFKAVSEGEQQLTGAAVVTVDALPGSPCGACRQVLHEFGPNIVVLMANPAGAVRRMAIGDLLPEAFGPGWVLPHIRKSHGSGEG